MRKIFAAVLGFGLLLAAQGLCAAQSEPVLVFGAASLTDAVEEIGRAFTAKTGVPVKSSFAASSALAKQIEAGAKADVFFPADQDWMNYLQERKLIQPQSRKDVVGNQLVLIAPADSTVKLKIAPGFALNEALAGGRIATGDPDSVPVGKYARHALTKLGVWEQVEKRLVRAENVRAALAYVARGEAALGIVYLTDARLENKVRIVDQFPAESHTPITYPIALTSAANPEARSFLEFATGESAAAIYRKYGFEPLR